MLLSAEAAKNAQRADLENHLETSQNALQDKQQVCVARRGNTLECVFVIDLLQIICVLNACLCRS